MNDKLEQDRVNGEKAHRLLTDPLLVEAFASIERAYLDAWKVSKPGDTEARERLWQAFQLIGIVQSNLRTVLDNGKLAQADLERIALLGRQKRFGVV